MCSYYLSPEANDLWEVSTCLPLGYVVISIEMLYVGVYFRLSIFEVVKTDIRFLLLN